jgi:hypothetical protein
MFGDSTVKKAVKNGYCITWMSFLGLIMAEPSGLQAFLASRFISRKALTAPNSTAVYNMVKTILNEVNVLLLAYLNHAGEEIYGQAMGLRDKSCRQNNNHTPHYHNLSWNKLEQLFGA